MAGKESLDPQYEWLTKQEVGEILGKSDKGIQRLTASGQLLVTYVKEGKIQRAYFRADDIAKFQEQDKPSKPTKPIAKETPSTIDTSDTVVNMSNVSSESLVQGKYSPEKIIADLVGRVLNEAQKKGLFSLGASGSTFPGVAAKEKLIVPIADKMVLSIVEASALSGRPQAELRKAFQAGKLHGVKLGRGIKVRREDLKLYIDGLFSKF